jgi:phosphatidylglycerol:prolipoprotein diacylglycerol transferase
MIPYIHIDPVHLGPLAIQPFGVLVATGVLLGIHLALRRARRLGMDTAQLSSFITWFLVSGFIGAHVFDSVFYHPSEVLGRPWTLLTIWGGLSSFGGFVGAACGAVAWKYFEPRHSATSKVGTWGWPVRRVRPIRILPYSDVILAVFPVAWIFGRAGCSVVHDHPGARASAESWFAVAYGPGPVQDFGLFELRHGIEPRYDLGLLEMLFAIALAAMFAVTWRRTRATGWYIVAACAVYSPVRFLLDFLRLQDADGGDLRYASLTPAQWACIGLFGFALALGVKLLRARGPSAEANATAS